MRRLKAATVRAALSTFCSFILLTTAHARADEPAARPFDISPQSLATALSEFARQSQQEILFAPEVVEQKLSGGVRGTMQPLAALKLLLKDSALTFTTTSKGAVLVGVPPSGGANPLSSGEEKVAPKATGEDDTKENHTPKGDQPKNVDERIRVTQADREPTASDRSVRQQDDQASKMSLVQLQEVIVTAQKREESLQKVPISISVLSGTQLENPTITSVTDALSTVPGVATNQSYNGGGTLVAIRGVSVGQALFAGSSPVAYYLDSVPFGLVKSAIAPDEDVYDLQRVEVLRGPQGTLYGANALNGVVRVLTNDANLTSFDVKVRASDSGTDGGGNNYRGDVAVNVPLIDDKLAARAVIGYENDSGWIDTPIKRRVNDAERRNYRLKINAQPTDEFSIGLSWWGMRDSYGAPNAAGDNYRNSSVLNQLITTDFDAYALKFGYGFSGYSLSSTTSYLRYSDNANFDFTSYLGGFPYALFTGLDSNVLSQEILLNSPSDKAWRWSVGGMYRRATEDRLQYDSLLGPVTGFTDTVDDTSNSFAAFGEVTRIFLDGRLEATAGLRQFEDDVTQEGHVSPTTPLVRAEGRFHATTPRAVLTWHASDNLMIYGSYSQGFRSGFPQDITVAAGFPPVKADKLYNYESGAKGSIWGGRASFEAAVYYMDWEHVQQNLQVPFENITTTAIVNGQSARGKGVDIAVTIQPLTALTFGINASWNNLEMDSAVYSGGLLLFHKGDRLSMSPETTAGASAAYAFALGASGLMGRLSASANYTSAQRYLANPGGPAFLPGTGDPMVIGRVGMSIDSAAHWTATLFVDNVNNERGAVIRPYELPDLTSRVRARTAGLQLEYHLK
jgi:iron complex outermembrane receptor protein